MEDRFRFRAWEKEEQKMYYDAESTYDYRCGGEGAFSESFGCLLDNDRFVVMQCTGLHDKNGTLIFEGDIVKYYPYGKPVEGIVLWDSECAKWEFSEQGCGEYNISEGHTGEVEIIGNVYDNPKPPSPQA